MTEHRWLAIEVLDSIHEDDYGDDYLAGLFDGEDDPSYQDELVKAALDARSEIRRLRETIATAIPLIRRKSAAYIVGMLKRAIGEDV